MSPRSVPTAARLALAVACVVTFVACGSLFSQADQAGVESDASKILACQSEGRACKADGGADCYGVYNRCMSDAGLRGAP